MKKIVLMMMVILFVVNGLSAQSKDTAESIRKDTSFNRIFTQLEESARFPGGKEEWEKYLKKNLNKSLKKHFKISGKFTIYVSFLVDKEGNLSEFKIANSENVNSTLAEESIRVLKDGPKWIPARQNGRKIYFQTVQSIPWNK